MGQFKLISSMQPKGDQPQAIRKLVEGFRAGKKEQVLMGVTGSGKTFTMAHVIEQLDKGSLRVAQPVGDDWQVNDWVKKAVIMYFPIQQMETIEVGPFEFADKLPLKRNFAADGVRVVPGASARWGSYLAPGVICMPSYVNIGARVGAGTMVDTWATVGSCAQIGEQVHLSGGVGIGGVLEPAQAAPVIIEDEGS